MDYASFAVNFTSRDSCSSFIRDSLEPFGLVPGSDTAVRLEVEAGTDPNGVKVYRPYTRMAALLARAKNEAHLNEGEGAKFRDADKTIAAWRSEQAELDAALSLILPVSAAPARRTTTFSRITSSF
jgi:hypothetical protein